jgi:hypothetical protein
MARVGARHGVEGPVVGQLADLGLVERAVEGALVQRGGEVEQRPRRCGDADALVVDHLLDGEHSRAMDPKARAAPRPGTRHGDVDEHGSASADLPQRAARRVAERGGPAAGEHRGEPPSPLAEERVADGVDTGVHAVQASGGHAPRDGALRKADVPELRA